jgi:hypothetical protein
MIKNRNKIDCALADDYEKDYVKFLVIVMWNRINTRPDFR